MLEVLAAVFLLAMSGWFVVKLRVALRNFGWVPDEPDDHGEHSPCLCRRDNDG